MIKTISEFLIIPLDTKASQKIYFKNNPEISNAILKGLQIPISYLEVGRYKPPMFIWTPFYYGTEIVDFTGGVTGSGYNSFFLTLVNYKGEEVHKNLCLASFYAATRAGKIFNHFYNQIDLSKSYIQCSGQPYELTPPLKAGGVLFNFIIKTRDI